MSDQKPSPETCGSCAFALWAGSTKTQDGREIGTGYCRFHPPAVVAVAIQSPSPVIGAAPVNQTQLQPTYALTNSDQWCAQHTTPEEYPLYKAARFGQVEVVESDPD